MTVLGSGALSLLASRLLLLRCMRSDRCAPKCDLRLAEAAGRYIYNIFVKKMLIFPYFVNQMFSYYLNILNPHWANLCPTSVPRKRINVKTYIWKDLLRLFTLIEAASSTET
jgi:hypothetical protein